ncbi:DUF6435 family protein [Aliidiomarina maris]|uniref:Lacal_2735 family protein n=1 Tax=Aliidiomarina maris TaxID=531312 RepID=A0A327WYT3_9GAMM|nr:DUF6435 family protein [Aliidiomarina maris]MCL5050544.1 DUF6435 family protein [Bacillota bacterium]RAJ98427.1 hypothetical protein B0I24_105180 [Aliidiomarina maris]
MFGLFKKHPTRQLRKELAQLQEKSMQAQRNGDIRTHSKLSAQADEIWREIQRLEAQSK